MKNSSIQWTDHTWNIARGCTKVDSDCKYCYMYRDSFNGTRYSPREVVKTKTVFGLPLKIKEPSKIFTCSLTDFYHVGCDSFRDEAYDIIRQCPQHIFQILTKRPERIIDRTPKDILEAKNIWFGTSIGSMGGLHRMYDLLDVPCKTRFVSFEPLHGRITAFGFNGIDWAIIGGESGNDTGQYRYRPCKIEWIEELVENLELTTAIFIKQLGTALAKEMKMSDRHGGNIDEFPEHLRTRNFPKVLTM